HPHDRALAELLLDLAEGQLEGLLSLHRVSSWTAVVGTVAGSVGAAVGKSERLVDNRLLEQGFDRQEPIAARSRDRSICQLAWSLIASSQARRRASEARR